MSKFVPRDYQVDIAKRGVKILKKNKILILALSMRLGKSLISFMISDVLGFKNVLFLTKKKAMESMTFHNDYELISPSFKITIINYESVHHIDTKDIDLVIIDEFHNLGKFPKPANRTKAIKKIVGSKPVILLSGSPSPESFSQWYHPLWVSDNSPFKKYSNFYKWCKDYVTVTQKRVAFGRMANDYSNANIDLISKHINPLMISFSKKEAGFKSTIEEEIIHIKMKDSTYNLANILVKDRVYENNGIEIVCDTPVSLMQKLHQVYSGTIKLEDGSRIVFDKTKAEFIQSKFKGKKIAIFYAYIGEKIMLEEVFGDTITNNIAEFDDSDKSYYGQIKASSEGISLRNAEALVYVSIMFSATAYLQSRERMVTKDSTVSKIYFIFSESGIEDKIHKAVMGKKSYTSRYFKKDFL